MHASVMSKSVGIEHCASDSIEVILTFLLPNAEQRIRIPKNICVSELKREIARLYRFQNGRGLHLLCKKSNRQITTGTIEDNNIVDGHIFVIIPAVETGLISPKSEQTVTQALESLSESQIEAFLSGKAPLHLTLRLGSHMMFIQLQLSNVKQGLPKETSQNVDQNNNELTSQYDEVNFEKLRVDDRVSKSNPRGAVIETVKHHGRGVYSGTFSGTIHPALRDINGRPRKNIDTVIRILNDLLGASPQYRLHMQSNSEPSTSENVPSDSVQVSKISIGKQDAEKKEENLKTKQIMNNIQLKMKEKRSSRKRNGAVPYPEPVVRKHQNSPSDFSVNPMGVDNKSVETSEKNSQYGSKLSSPAKVVVV